MGKYHKVFSSMVARQPFESLLDALGKAGQCFPLFDFGMGAAKVKVSKPGTAIVLHDQGLAFKDAEIAFAQQRGRDDRMTKVPGGYPGRFMCPAQVTADDGVHTLCKVRRG